MCRIFLEDGRCSRLSSQSRFRWNAVTKIWVFNKYFPLCGSGGFFHVNLLLKSSNVTLFLNPDLVSQVGCSA